MVLAFLVALGIRTELVAIVNAGLFGLFLFLKLFLVFTRQGSNCGCFGAHELSAIDLPSVIASILVLGLAVIFAALAQWSATNAFEWMVALIFLMAFGWLVFKTLQRRRLEDKLIHRRTTAAFT